MTLIEALLALLHVAVGLVVAWYVGHAFGGLWAIFGFVGGMVGLFVMLQLLAKLAELSHRRRS